MPPARSRANPTNDDSRSDTSVGGSREKVSTTAEKRRQALGGAAAVASEKSLLVPATTNANGTHAHEGIEGMGWQGIDLDTLHRYRHAYKLQVPSASGGFNNTVLSTGIGRKAPSRSRARSSRDALATAVRKNFNAQPIQENDVIVNFLYSVKNQDKHFRLRFPPPFAKKHDS